MIRGFSLLAIGVCGMAWAATPDAATPTPSPSLSPIVAGEKNDGPRVSAFAPLAYFNENCARCHGEYGANYAANFGEDRSEESLHEIVEEMADGPGQAPLAPAELDAVTDWHRALRDKKPFVVIVKSEKTDAGFQLSGEISPDATLEINGENVEVDGSNWTICVAAGALKLRATKGEAVTELDANTASWAPSIAQSAAQ